MTRIESAEETEPPEPVTSHQQAQCHGAQHQQANPQGANTRGANTQGNGILVAVADEQPHEWAAQADVVAAVEEVLRHAGVSEAKISIAILDDPTIHELNRRYLDHDYPTDVLSFALNEPSESLVGEVIVSTDTAQRMASQVDWPAAYELMLYVVHGTLHLVGYRDKSPTEAEQMHQAEAAVLRKLGLARSPLDPRWGQPIAATDSSPAKGEN